MLNQNFELLKEKLSNIKIDTYYFVSCRSNKKGGKTKQKTTRLKQKQNKTN